MSRSSPPTAHGLALPRSFSANPRCPLPSPPGAAPRRRAETRPAIRGHPRTAIAPTRLRSPRRPSRSSADSESGDGLPGPAHGPAAILNSFQGSTRSAAVDLRVRTLAATGASRAPGLTLYPCRWNTRAWRWWRWARRSRSLKKVTKGTTRSGAVGGGH